MQINQISPFCFEIPKTGAMRVDGRIFTSKAMLSQIVSDQSLQQVVNMAALPGILPCAMAMPDVHQGYGFPIGGVAAFDWNDGIISPGGVGYDINCGVRLASTGLSFEDISPLLEKLADALFNAIPSGVGSTGFVKLTQKEEKKVLRQGSKWAVSNGMGVSLDVEHTEETGCLPQADPDALSPRAIERGRKQLGTLGSGNHFLEIGVVQEIYDPDAASAFGLAKGQVTVLLHSGSRGLGHQVCDDFLKKMTKHAAKMDIELPDRQLACAWINSSSGQQYYSAMACAANYAWANRQILMHQAKDAILKTLGIGPAGLGMSLVYDVCHNIAKKETHVVNGEKRTLCIHRKGATRAFAPGHPDVCQAYRAVGQPVLVPGDMGTCSYVLAGTQQAMEKTFGSTCHGAGRVMSRTRAKKAAKGRVIYKELADKGIIVRWTGRSTMAEEAPEAYKDVSQVVDVVHGAGISKKVAKLIPVVVIKG